MKIEVTIETTKSVLAIVHFPKSKMNEYQEFVILDFQRTFRASMIIGPYATK